MKPLDLLLEMYNNGEIQMYRECHVMGDSCNSCRKQIDIEDHSADCRMVKLFAMIENHRPNKVIEEERINKYKKELNDRMNARITGPVEVYYYEGGEEVSADYDDSFVGQKIKISKQYGRTYDIEEFENHVIDHEFYRYQITDDKFEFLGEIVT